MCIHEGKVQEAVFFFNDTATTEIYTLSLHDALPISSLVGVALEVDGRVDGPGLPDDVPGAYRPEEHTSELQSPCNLVCRLLLEKTTTTYNDATHSSRPLHVDSQRVTLDR